MFGEDYIIAWINSLPLKYQLSLGIILLTVFNLLVLIGMIAANVFLITNSNYLEYSNYFDNREFNQIDNNSDLLDISIYNYLSDEKDYVNIIKGLWINFQEFDDLLTYEELNKKVTIVSHGSKDIDPSNPNQIGIYDSGAKFICTAANGNRAAKDILANFLPLLRWIRKIKLFELAVLQNVIGTLPADMNQIIFSVDCARRVFYYPANIKFDSNIADCNENDSIKKTDTCISHFSQQWTDYFATEMFEIAKQLINTYNQTIIPDSSKRIPEEKLTKDFIKNNYPLHIEKEHAFYKAFKPEFQNQINAQIISKLGGSLNGNLIVNKGAWFSDSITISFELISNVIRYLLINFDRSFSVVSKVECMRMISKAKYQYENKGFKPIDFNLTDLPDIFSPQFDNTTLTLKDCFSSYTYNDLTKKFDLDYDILEEQLNLTNIKFSELANPIPHLVYQNESTKDNFNNNLRLKISNSSYKIKNKLVPLTYFLQPTKLTKYPLQFLHMGFVINNEGFVDNVTRTLYINSISSFISSLIASLIINYIVAFFLLKNLVQAMSLIEKPLTLIDEAIKSISEPDKFKEAKTKLENYMITEKNYLEEFVDLVSIILNMIQGNMDSNQKQPVSKETKQFLDSKDIQRDYYIVKANNIMIYENKLKNKIVSDSYFKQIQQLNLDEIMKDPKIKSVNFFSTFVEKYTAQANKAREHQNNEGLDSLSIESRKILKKLVFAFDKNDKKNYKHMKSYLNEDFKENKGNNLFFKYIFRG